MKLYLAVLCTWFSIANANAQSNTIIYLSAEENRFYQMINQFRAELNLPQMQLHVYIQNAAKKHSEWMAQQDFLTHYGPINNKNAVSAHGR